MLNSSLMLMYELFTALQRDSRPSISELCDMALAIRIITASEAAPIITLAGQIEFVHKGLDSLFCILLLNIT